MKKFYEEPIIETAVIVDVVSDELETPTSGSDGVI